MSSFVLSQKAASLDYIPPRLRSSRPAVDSNGLFTAVGEGLNQYLVSEQAPSESQPFFAGDFPDDRLDKADAPFDGITFKVIASNLSPTRADGTVNRKPFIFQEKDPDTEGYQSVTMMWWEVLTIEFTIWSKSSPTRSTLTNWFHKFMYRYANIDKFFEARGADMFEFVGRGEDGFETRENQKVYFSTLTYQFRVQYLDTFRKRMITDTTLRLNVSDQTQTSA